MIGRFRIRRFRTRLLLLIVGLLASTQFAAYVLVSRANRANAIEAIGAALDRGARQFQSIVTRREADLLLAANIQASVMGESALRFVTHKDVTPADCETAGAALIEASKAS